MLPEQWQKLGEIFQNAADLAPDSQTVYLDQVCRGDLELRDEVEAPGVSYFVALETSSKRYAHFPVFSTRWPHRNFHVVP
jgi:hypothetical protein